MLWETHWLPDLQQGRAEGGAHTEMSPGTAHALRWASTTESGHWPGRSGEQKPLFCHEVPKAVADEKGLVVRVVLCSPQMGLTIQRQKRVGSREVYLEFQVAPPLNHPVNTY